MSQEPITHHCLSVKDVRKEYRMGELVVSVLQGVNLAVDQGELIAIVGPSGSGKSTLLGILGGLDQPSSGEVTVAGVEISRMHENKLAELRNAKIGFVFQSFNLIPTLTAQENVALPMQFARSSAHDPMQRSRQLLELLGLGERLNHRPAEMSGGQQQRVAIARALANNPPIILADEPTGNLDTAAGELVVEALQTIRRDMGTTLVIVTHDLNLAAKADRQIVMRDGQIVSSSTGASGNGAHGGNGTHGDDDLVYETPEVKFAVVGSHL